MKSILKSQPLTARGLILIVFFVSLLKFVVIDDADIVATVITHCFLIIIIFSLVGSLLGKLLLKRKLHLIDSSSGTTITAQQKSVFTFKLPKFFIFPFFQLTVDFIFDHPLENQPSYILSGKSSFLPLTITFPHRGLWTIEGVKFTFGDRFGICSSSWNDSDMRIAISVQPPLGYADNLPILSSFFRAGDENLNVTERQGDPYDIKRYHPSDGIRKIIWKLFAKNENLMARDAEPSVCSEGQVALFCLARTQDDNAAASAIAYSKRLEHEELELYASCPGSEICRTPDTFKEALIRHAFDTPDLVQSLETFIEAVQESLNNHPLQQLIIFIDKAFFYDSNAISRILEISNFLDTKQIKAAFFLVGTIPHHVLVKSNMIMRYFFKVAENDSPQSSYNEFIALARTKDLQIYTEEYHA